MSYIYPSFFLNLNKLTTSMKNFSLISLSLFFLFSVIDINEVKAQGFADKSFHTLGYSPFLEFGKTPVVFYNGFSNFDEDAITRKFGTQGSSFTILSLNYTFRYNLVEVSDNFAIGALVNPGLGLSLLTFDTGVVDASYIGSFSLPIMASLDFGAGATYDSGANMGGFFAAGIEYNVNPLFDGDEVIDEADATVSLDKSWVQPVLAAGVRFWSRNNRLREVSLKYGFKNGGEYLDQETGETETAKIYTFRLSFNWMLNY